MSSSFRNCWSMCFKKFCCMNWRLRCYFVIFQRGLPMCLIKLTPSAPSSSFIVCGYVSCSRKQHDLLTAGLWSLAGSMDLSTGLDNSWTRLLKTLIFGLGFHILPRCLCDAEPSLHITTWACKWMIFQSILNRMCLATTVVTLGRLTLSMVFDVCSAAAWCFGL